MILVTAVRRVFFPTGLDRLNKFTSRIDKLRDELNKTYDALSDEYTGTAQVADELQQQLRKLHAAKEQTVRIVGNLNKLVA